MKKKSLPNMKKLKWTNYRAVRSENKFVHGSTSNSVLVT